MPVRKRIMKLAGPAGALVLAVACGSGGGTTTATAPVTPPAGVAVSGLVAGPSGGTSQASQAALRMALRQAAAAAATTAPNTAPLGAGTTVDLIQIDGGGNQVGAVLATGTTDANGAYTLTAPHGFVPGPAFVVRASVAGKPMQAFVTATTADIDPYTQATVTLVTGSLQATGAAIAALAAGDIAAVQQTVLANSGDIALTGATTAAQMAAALGATVTNDVEGKNIVTSLGAPSGITGTVLDSGGNPVAGAQILVRSFGDQTTAAVTRTDAAGAYTVHVAAGNYILGAVNDTTASMAASAWWTAGGGAISQFKADKIAVATGTVTRNFTLQPGGRLYGSVTAGDTGLPLAGITVALNDFASGQTLMFLKTLPDGTMTFNVPAGTYYVSLRNSTLQPYATTVIHDGVPGNTGINKTQASVVTVTAGQVQGGSIALPAAHQIQGTVSDPTLGPVAGIVVRFQDFNAGGAGSESVRTGLDGSYRLWVQPGKFNVFCRGQQAVGLDLTSGDQTQDFTAAVGQVTAMLQDPAGNPLSQVVTYLYDSTSGSAVGWEIANSDGSVTLYCSAATAAVRVGFLVDDLEMIGSSIYSAAAPASGLLQPLTSGTAIPAPAAGTTTALGPVILPYGSVLAGTVTALATGAPAANMLVQVRVGGIRGGNKMMSTRTMSDGSYSISLPAGATLASVIAFAPNTSFSFPSGNPLSVPGVYAMAENVVMGAQGTTTTLPALSF